MEKQELVMLLNTILDHKYMQFNDQFYKQNDGLAMGAPMSAILVETFLQHLEHTKIIKILDKHQIIDYCKYVDVILIIYDTNTTNIGNTLTEFDSRNPNIKSAIEIETHNTLNCLDLSITHNHNKLTFGI
jgi:hypothetical protein